MKPRVIGFLTVAPLVLSAVILAQTPLGTAFTYQGQIKQDSSPFSGTCDFIFILYNASLGGSQVGSILNPSAVAVNNGLFTATLDFGAVFLGDKLWLEIQARCPAGSGGYAILSPRQELTASPYASYAPTAGSAAITPWSGLTGVPTGLADGDNDTTYSAGAGLNLIGTAFSASFGGSGAATQVARSDHDHLGQTWTGSGNPLVITGSFDATDSAALLLSNSGSVGAGLRASSVGGNGVRGLSTGGASADNGVYGETNSNTPSEAGVKGASTSAAAGGHFESSSGHGAYGSTSSASDFGGYFTNSTTTTTGGALYASGDAKQSLAGDGFVKAGVYVNCGNASSLIDRSFNNVNTTSITVIDGAAVGRCTIDFGFDVSNRYVTAMAYGGYVARIVTFIDNNTDNSLDFFRFDPDGVGVNGGIMIVIY